QVQFLRLGENRLTIRYGKHQHMFLEFFSTESLETLIKKRAAFLARSQHRDPSKWYNGLITDWNMDSKVRLSPDNYDRIQSWRIYDYPHIVLLYHSMYRLAKNNPQIKTALPAAEYLRRAYGTALALFTVPMQIEGWSAYRTGLYNEVVIVDLIADLRAEGMIAEAETLKGHWEQKVKTFVNGQ